MNPIKIIFFDIDGTLVDHSTGRIPEKTYEALHRLREKGILLCIATGRAPASLPDFDGFRFDALCTFNGSLAYTQEQTIHADPLSPENVTKVIANANAIGRPVSIATRDGLSANGIDIDLADYYRLAGLELTADPNFDLVCREDIYQIMLGCREADFDAIVQGTSGVKLAVSWDRAVDVISATSGKGAAIRKMVEFFHLKPEESLAFGDSFNDIDMLQAAGTGVAMGNATPKLKQVADDVCGHVSEDGIYHYCVDHGLI